MRRPLSGCSRGSRRWRVRVSKDKKNIFIIFTTFAVALCRRIEHLSSLYTQIASDDPFLALRDRPSFMEKTVLAMFVQESHADFQVDNDGLRPITGLSRELLCRAQLWIKDRLPSNATRRRSSKVDK